MKHTDTPTLAGAMDILARDIQSSDGIANAAIAEAAERLRELERENAKLREALKKLRARAARYMSQDSRAIMEADGAIGGNCQSL